MLVSHFRYLTVWVVWAAEERGERIEKIRQKIKVRGRGKEGRSEERNNTGALCVRAKRLSLTFISKA